MKRSMMMWGCVALIGVAVAVALAGANLAFAPFLVACVLMMGAMMWMMTRGTGGGSDGG